MNALLERLIDRKQMPQVASAHLHDMLSYLGDHGVSAKSEIVHPSKLKPVQKLNPDKVKAMADNPRSLDKPNLVANDYTIVDGHHRWGAAVELDKPMNVIRLDASFDKIRSLLKNYENTQYKGLKEESMEKESILAEQMTAEMQNIMHVFGSPGRVRIMSGATLVYSEKNDSVTLAGIKNSAVTHIVISYDFGNDLYNIDAYKLRGVNLKLVNSRKGVFLNEILRTVEGLTGLSFHL